MQHLLNSFIFIALLGEGMLTAATERYVITSPNAQVRVEIREDVGRLSYSVSWQDRTMLPPSKLALFEGGKFHIAGTVTNAADRVWKPVWGQFSQVHDHFRELVLHLETDAGKEVVLQCRVFNDGLGLRFAAGGKSAPTKAQINFRSEYRWPDQSNLFWARGEHEPVGPVSLATFAQQKLPLTIPVVMQTGGGTCAALLESDLYSAKQFSTMKLSHAADDASVLVAESGAQVDGSAWQTPWRVLLFGRSPGDLLVSTTPLNLAAECRLADAAWIKPGKSMWDWRVHGYLAGDFRYGVNTASYERFINFAATNNILYLLMDAGWFHQVNAGRLEAVAEINLPEIMRYARERGVEVLLYYDRKKGVVENNELFPQLANLGAVGVKYGFMGDNAVFTREAIDLAGAQRLLMDFHDSPCPMTGVERTMPNAVAREYCHSQQDGRRCFSPQGFLKMAMINALTGPLDQANGAYGLNSINAGGREKGPQSNNTYNSTVVSETARIVVIFSGLISLPDVPEEYAKKADLFEFIRQMPATWDETRVSNSRIGTSITTARRSGRQWFVGSVINEHGGHLVIPLDFLEPGVEYDATFYEDAVDSHYITNRETYRVRPGTLRQGDSITATLAPGGGHCVWIRPRSRSPQSNPQWKRLLLKSATKDFQVNARK